MKTKSDAHEGTVEERQRLDRERDVERDSSTPLPLPRSSSYSMRWYRRTRWITIAVVIVIIAAIALLIEELWYGNAFIWHMNRFNAEIYRPITVHRSGTPPSIAIVIVLKDALHGDEYALASSTVHCYAGLHGYNLLVVNAAANPVYKTECPQPDFMFHRHCVLRHLMEDMDEDWILFLDADIGVINPNHLIEEYLPTNSSTHIVFYDRIMNHEVMAGSYLLRNNEYSRRFLKYWADYYFSLPGEGTFHGTDNGALHNVLLEFTLPELRDERARCERVWHRSRDFPSLGEYVSCTREIMKGKDLGGIEIRNKTNAMRWCRDGWLTNNVWSDHDFMVHGWQKRRLDILTFARWHSPLTRSPMAGHHSIPLMTISQPEDLLRECATNRPFANHRWSYKDSFIETDGQIASRIRFTVDALDEDRKITVAKLKDEKILL